jgi:hypothetical protein
VQGSAVTAHGHVPQAADRSGTSARYETFIQQSHRNITDIQYHIMIICKFMSFSIGTSPFTMQTIITSEMLR